LRDTLRLESLHLLTNNSKNGRKAGLRNRLHSKCAARTVPSALVVSALVGSRYVRTKGDGQTENLHLAASRLGVADLLVKLCLDSVGDFDAIAKVVDEHELSGLDKEFHALWSAWLQVGIVAPRVRYVPAQCISLQLTRRDPERFRVEMLTKFLESL
jgi:hypothetical protein